MVHPSRMCYKQYIAYQIGTRFSESSTLALPDPIPTLTVNAITYDFARVGFGDSKAIYQTSTGNDRLTIEHSQKARNRHVVRLDRKATVADPLTTGSNFETSFSVYTVIDMPRVGFSAATVDYGRQLLEAFMVAGTPDYGLRVIQGEI